jgi:hypothetical protein
VTSIEGCEQSIPNGTASPRRIAQTLSTKASGGLVAAPSLTPLSADALCGAERWLAAPKPRRSPKADVDGRAWLGLARPSTSMSVAAGTRTAKTINRTSAPVAGTLSPDDRTSRESIL